MIVVSYYLTQATAESLRNRVQATGSKAVVVQYDEPTSRTVLSNPYLFLQLHDQAKGRLERGIVFDEMNTQIPYQKSFTVGSHKG